MAINYPTSLDTLSNPSSTDLVENATAALDHDVQHSNANDAIEALEAKVGANSSAVTTSHDYKLSEVTSTDKSVGKTATQTLTNKTLTSPVVNVGSDATGDLYYRNGSGVFTRLPIGSTSDILTVTAGIPAWITNPAAADASTTVKGVVEIATTAEITAGTSAGATGAKLVVPADAVGTSASKIVQLDSSARLPAVDGSQLTNIPYPVFKTGKSSRTSATGTGTLDIAHGLGAAPKLFKLSYYYAQTGGSNPADFVMGTGTCTSTSDETCSWLVGITSASDVNGGTSGQIIHAENSTATETLAVSVSAIDATNVTLSFNTFTATATVYWQWEAYT